MTKLAVALALGRAARLLAPGPLERLELAQANERRFRALRKTRPGR
jgi:hypothetical protein